MLIILQNKYPMSKQEEDSILLRLEKQLDLGNLLLIPECLYVQDIIMDQNDNSIKLETKQEKQQTVGEFFLEMTKESDRRVTVHVRRRLDEHDYRNLLSITVSNFARGSYAQIDDFNDYVKMLRAYEKQVTGQEIATLSLLWDEEVKYKDSCYRDDLSRYEYNIVV